MVDDGEFPAVLAAARIGDERAMALLFRGLHPKVIRFLRSQESRAAEDLAGEVWMAVARGLRSFEGDAAAFRAWVFTIARRRVADHRRRGMRHDTQPVDVVTFERLPATDDTGRQAVDALSGQDAAALVTATLPPDQAEVVLLRVLADLSVDEVAAIVGQSANWVRVTQHRALKRLADRLGPRIDVIR